MDTEGLGSQVNDDNNLGGCLLSIERSWYKIYFRSGVPKFDISLILIYVIFSPLNYFCILSLFLRENREDLEEEKPLCSRPL